jgi:hypothetical protein
MPSVSEAASGANTPLAADLRQGVDTISYDQVVNFELYVRLVLPLDGYVFWVKKTALGSSSMFNMAGFNSMAFNESDVSAEPGSFQAKGSLHYTTDAQQLEDSSSSRNRVVFTSEQPIENLNAVDPQVMYIGRFDGPQPGDVSPTDSTEIQFAFSSRSSYYQQSGLWHYNGSALLQSMSTQIIDDPNDLLGYPLIVSNSLPSWLALSYYNPPWPVPVPMPTLQFYPSFLLPDNLSPPYAAVHIDPGGTEGWQTMPTLGPMTDQYQLARDRVSLTLYGCSNDVAQSVLYAILQYSMDTEVFGILNIPVVRDEKEGQVELHAISQKKRISFEVSYNQSAIRDIARQLITSCIPTVQVGDEVVSHP